MAMADGTDPDENISVEQSKERTDVTPSGSGSSYPLAAMDAPISAVTIQHFPPSTTEEHAGEFPSSSSGQEGTVDFVQIKQEEPEDDDDVEPPLQTMNFVELVALKTDPGPEEGAECPATTLGNQIGASCLLTTTPTQQSQFLSSGAGPAPASTPMMSSEGELMRGGEEAAKNYVNGVKQLFKNQIEVYDSFVDTMKEFKSFSLDISDVIDRVIHLFYGYPELIAGFNLFLPPNYKIEIQMDGDYVTQGERGKSYKVIKTYPTTTAATASGSGNQNSSGLTTAQLATPTVFGFGSLAFPSITPATPARLPALLSIGNSFRPIISGGSPSTTTSFIQAPTTIPIPPPEKEQKQAEFNLAIEYVNKIKSRFASQPHKYKQFQDILHTYRKQQRNTQPKKDGDTPPTKQLTESEIYKRVSKLFHNHEDLLEEFGRFLPEVVQQASPAPASTTVNKTLKRKGRTPLVLKKTEKTHLEDPGNKPSKKQNQQRQHRSKGPPTPTASTSSSSRTSLASSSKSPKKSATAHPTKRLLLNPLPAKKTRSSTSSSLPLLKTNGSSSSSSGTGKLVGTHYQDVALFDKVRAYLRWDHIYENFVKTLQLYNKGVFSRSETVTMITPFLSKAPELFASFKDFMGHCEQAKKIRRGDSVDQDKSIPTDQQEPSSQDQDHVQEINYASCKRLGTSYCAIPLNFEPPKCSGRTSLCDSVLNDAYVNFPTTWYEDNPMKTARRNPYELQMSQCEDERFELDFLMDSNRDTIGWLETLQYRMARMSPAQLKEFKLDENNCGGGDLPTIHLRSIRRIYGEKAGALAIEGMKKVPKVAIPLVIKRLKQKDAEWREAQKSFNRIWRERQERCYLKSLDHQGLYFRQGDIRALRSKTLIGEIEAKYDERLDLDESSGESSSNSSPPRDEPHLTLPYRDRSVFDDALELILHRVRRQETISREDKQEIKKMLKQFIPDLFNHPRMELSDDEEENFEEAVDEPPSPSKMNGETSRKKSEGSERGSDSSTAPIGQKESRRTLAKRHCKSSVEDRRKQQKKEDQVHKISAAELKFLFMDDDKLEQYKVNHQDQEETYKLFFANNTWYVFLRLHQILCERLTQFLETANETLLESEPKESREQKSAAVALGLKSKPEIDIEEYYTTFLELVKDLLDGNLEAGSYEDQLLQMFGIHAYVGYTLDEVITNAVRLLQRLVSDKGCRDCLKFYLDADGKGGTGGPIATASERVRDEGLYRCRSEKVFGETNCMKVIIFQKSSVMTVELLDGESSPPESQPTPEEQAEWTSYMKDYINPGNIFEGNFVNPENPLKLFLNRNRRKLFAEDENMKAGASNSAEREEQLAICQIPIRVLDETNLVQATGSQHRFNPSSYEMVFPSGGEDCFYRRGMLWKARKTHKAVSLSMWRRFKNWHGDWLLKNTTMEDKADCAAWLKENPKHDDANAKKKKKNIVKVRVSDPEDEVPYHKYNRYVIK